MYFDLTDFSGPISCRVSTIQQQLAQLDNESWPGLAEADRDRLQLIKEKEALLQELQLIIQQRRPVEDVARLEEERRRLEEEIQRARATSVQGATERCAGSRGFGSMQASAPSEEPGGKAKLENLHWAGSVLSVGTQGSTACCVFLPSSGKAGGAGNVLPLFCGWCQLGPGLVFRSRRG